VSDSLDKFMVYVTSIFLKVHFLFGVTHFIVKGKSMFIELYFMF